MIKDVMESLKKGEIVESGMSRILKHSQDTGFAILTSFRPEEEASLSQNKASFKQLKDLVRANGFGFVEMIGVWTNEEENRLDKEPSLFVPNAREKGKTGKDLFTLMKDLCKKFNQDAFVFKDEKRAGLFDKSGKQLLSGNVGSVDSIAKAYSTLTKGGSQKDLKFSFSMTSSPQSYVEAIRRIGEGEITSVGTLHNLIHKGRIV